MYILKCSFADSTARETPTFTPGWLLAMTRHCPGTLFGVLLQQHTELVAHQAVVQTRQTTLAPAEEKLAGMQQRDLSPTLHGQGLPETKRLHLSLDLVNWSCQ